MQTVLYSREIAEKDIKLIQSINQETFLATRDESWQVVGHIWTPYIDLVSNQLISIHNILVSAYITQR